MLKIIKLIRRAVKYPFLWVYGRCCGVPYKKSWIWHGWPLIKCGGEGSSITIGEHFVACSLSLQNAIGVNQRVVIRTCSPNAHIRIGDNVGVSGCTISANRSITIGSRVLIGSGALIMDNDAHPLDYRSRMSGSKGASSPIIIEDDVFIGARAIILKGVKIGLGAVVGAGAVVTKDVPQMCVVAGNPARIVKSI